MRVDVSRKDGDIPDGYVCLGEVLAHFGIRGEFKIFLSNPDSQLLNKQRKVRFLMTDGAFVDYKLSIRSGAGKKIIGRIAEISDRDGAAQIIGSKILYETKRLPRLEETEWYHYQIIGLPVRTQSGESMGSITEIVPGEVEVWVAESDEYQIYIPYTSDDVLSVSLTDGVIIPDLGER